GRAVLKALPRRSDGPALDEASTHLRRAVDHKNLSPHRREVAERLLTEIS
ncbi:MAG: hypothetical protein QOH06_232, partial [Acidobacteriota bacterium]|nr:hypothetical protein [Acidobacteriota bacterium]